MRLFVCSWMTLLTKRVKQCSSEHLVLWKSLQCWCYPIERRGEREKCDIVDYERKRRQSQKGSFRKYSAENSRVGKWKDREAEEQEEIEGGRRGWRDICFVSGTGYRLIAGLRERKDEWERGEGDKRGVKGTDWRGKRVQGVWKTLQRWKCLIGRDRHYHKLQNSEGMSLSFSVCVGVCVYGCVCTLSVGVCRCVCFPLGELVLAIVVSH